MRIDYADVDISYINSKISDKTEIITKVALPTITTSDFTNTGKYVLTYKVGNDKGMAEYATSAYTPSDDVELSLVFNTEDAKAALAGDGFITKTFTITWSVYDADTDSVDDITDLKSSELVQTFTQTVTVRVDVNTLTIRENDGDADDKAVWNADIAKAYKATLVSATPAEEDKTTEENKKDDVPKTGEVIPMALVGMMSLGLAGAYTFKKSYNRKRQIV